MSSIPWWGNITAGEILLLRERVVDSLAAAFPAVPAAEREDFVQQAFVALFRQRDGVRPEEDGLFRYLLVAARNTALDRLKALAVRARARLLAGTPSISSSPSPEVATQVREENERLRGIFCELSPLDRFVLWRYVVDGSSILAIAKELDLNWHRVEKMLDQILGEVRRRLNDAGR